MARVELAPKRRTAVRRNRRALTDAPLTEVEVRIVRRRLLRWGRSHFKQYPWRTETDPWLSLLAEFLLQRTRASQVEPVFRTIRQRHPTPQSLVAGGLLGVKGITGKLGLHWRGPLLLRVALAVAARGGAPPETMAELRALPGVGMYTAAAWLSLHRGKRAAIIDANVARWLSRMTGLPYNRDPRHVQWLKELADRVTPRRAFRDFNYAVLDFTMNVCTRRNPGCDRCPIRSECRYGLRRRRLGR